MLRVLEHVKIKKLASWFRLNKNLKSAKKSASNKLTLAKYAKSIVKNTRLVRRCLNFSDLSGSIFKM